jgi:excisionase family DNA binding protein
MLQQVLVDSEKAAKIAANEKRLPSSLLTRRQVAERLGVCSHTVQHLTRKGLLPALVFNQRLIRYTEETVDAFIADAKVHPCAPVPASS